VLATARTVRLLATAVVVIDGGPAAALGFLFRKATLLVALGDVVRLALLLVGVLRQIRDKLKKRAEGLVDKGVEGAKEVAAENYEAVKAEADRKGLTADGETTLLGETGRF
jgi:hypothetical protein